MQHMTAPELAQLMQDAAQPQPLLLDVREPWEFDTCHIGGSQLIQMNAIPARHVELNKEMAIVCICHHGGRSMQVAYFLENNGFTHIINLTGGVHAWAQQVDASMPTY
ncbi:MAG: rhodanese-like domain-containing protein [Oxalobacteraceae bacterium]